MTRSPEPVFVKFGGSLITDKARPETPREEVIARLAREVRRAREADAGLRLLIGHGSGSFGHWHASQFGTREGVRGRDAWRGYAQVAASAARLNQLVTDALLQAGVPALAVRPSSSARCHDGVLVGLDTRPIHRALEEGLVPLIHGDVALDDVRGGTIVSTEELLVYLVEELRPGRVLLLGETPGVLRDGGAPDRGAGEGSPRVIPYITPSNLEAVAGSLGGSRGRDVTGGMVSKVRQMVRLVARHPDLTVTIMSGREPGLLTRALLEPELAVGTRIAARSPAEPRG